MNKPIQLDLFPYRETLEEVIVELIEGLPITEPNQLIAALSVYGNTLVKVMAQAEDSDDVVKISADYKDES